MTASSAKLFVAFVSFCSILLGSTSASESPAAENPTVIPLWFNGAPGFESRKNEREQTGSYWVKNIHNPSLTVYAPAKDKANGAAVLICPGGGHRELVFKSEGTEPAQYLNELGVTAFILKYRLARETNSPYSLPVHPLQDVQRAMRVIRSRASEWDLDTKRIGVMGFSAGAEVAALLVYNPSAGDPSAADPIDRVGCAADFQIIIYPGPLGIPTNGLPADIPPAFFVVASDDYSHVHPVLKQIEDYCRAKKPVELHLYAKGGHGFNMGGRSKLGSIKTWPQRLTDWLQESGYLPAGSTAAK